MWRSSEYRSNSSPSRNRPMIWVALALPPAPGLATPSHTKQQWDITQVQSQRVQVSGMVRLEQSSGLLFLWGRNFLQPHFTDKETEAKKVGSSDYCSAIIHYPSTWNDRFSYPTALAFGHITRFGQGMWVEKTACLLRRGLRRYHMFLPYAVHACDLAWQNIFHLASDPKKNMETHGGRLEPNLQPGAKVNWCTAWNRTA